MKKILIFGAAGMAGHMVSSYLKSLNKYTIYEVTHNKITNKDNILCDVLDIKSVENVIDTIKPNIVINCIGILNDVSDSNILKTTFINSFFPQFLRHLSLYKDIKIIHLSTDCVFNGKLGSYTESSFKDETNIYGLSKNLGEIIDSDNLTFRTSIIGPELKSNGKGLFHWFMNQKGTINGYKNVFWTGVTTLELAKAIDKAIDDNLTGLYHLVQASKICKYDMLSIIKDIFNKNDVSISEEYSTISDKSLVNTRNDFDFKVSTYEKMINDMYQWMLKDKELYKQYFN